MRKRLRREGGGGVQHPPRNDSKQQAQKRRRIEKRIQEEEPLEDRIVNGVKSGRHVNYEDYGREGWKEQLKRLDYDFMKDTEDKERSKNYERSKGYKKGKKNADGEEESCIDAESMAEWRKKFEMHRQQNAYSVSEGKREEFKRLSSASVYDRGLALRAEIPPISTNETHPKSVVINDDDDGGDNDDYDAKECQQMAYKPPIPCLNVRGVTFSGTRKPTRL